MACAPKIASTDNGRPILGLGAVSRFHYIMIFLVKYIFLTNQHHRMALKFEWLYLVFFFLHPFDLLLFLFLSPSETYCAIWIVKLWIVTIW
jgi:hypothetical protein